MSRASDAHSSRAIRLCDRISGETRAADSARGPVFCLRSAFLPGSAPCATGCGRRSGSSAGMGRDRRGTRIRRGASRPLHGSRPVLTGRCAARQSVILDGARRAAGTFHELRSRGGSQKFRLMLDLGTAMVRSENGVVLKSRRILPELRPAIRNIVSARG